LAEILAFAGAHPCWTIFCIALAGILILAAHSERLERRSEVDFDRTERQSRNKKIPAADPEGEVSGGAN